MNFLKLTHDVLNVTEISEQVLHESCGAVSVFIGTTRDNFDGRPVTTLEYEAYEPMALSSMDTICTEIRKRWPEVKHIAMYHRLGFVAVKEASIVIALSSPHRLDSMHAVEYAMDRTKSSVPIWKKEYYAKENETSQDSQWKENKECQWSQHMH